MGWPAPRSIARALLLALVLTASVTGCSIGDIRRPAPVPEPSLAPAPPTTRLTRRDPDEIRQVRVPVPSDFAGPIFEFIDAWRGYALFTRCGAAEATGGSPIPSCRAILFATSDGGHSWQERKLPQPIATNHQLYAGNGALLLLAEPHGWYLSTDGGETFEHRADRDLPPGYQGVFGRFQVCCYSDSNPRVFEYVGRQGRPLSAQPPVPRLTSVAYAGDRLAVAGLRDGRAYAAISADRGRTWRQTAVPALDGGLVGVQVQMSVDGGDAWLIGYGADRTAFPQLWLNTGDQWERVVVRNHPERSWSVAPLRAGMLAVSGPSGSGVIVGETYNDLGWPSGADHLRTLEDGTLFGVHEADGSAWLAQGYGAERHWTKLTLDRL